MPRFLKVARKPAYDPPGGLSERSQSLWRQIVPASGRSPGRLALLGEALRALDRVDQARAIIDVEGMTFTTESTGAVHVHPALRIEKDSRAQFLQAWNTLNLHWSFEDSNPS